jgi:uncharacterized membrane protein
MNLRPMLIVNGLLVAGMAAVSVWGWQVLPEGAQLPTQFDLEGNAKQFTGKSTYLVLMPSIAAGLTALLWVIPHLDPRHANMEASIKFWNVAAILSCALLAYVHALLVLSAAGYKIDVTSALVPGLSVLFIGLGNYLGKTRSNWFGGVRTPWSLSSEYSWEKTHRWSGRMMVGSGLVAFAAWFAVDAKIALLILIGLVLATAVVSVVLSYVFWHTDPARVANGTH